MNRTLEIIINTFIRPRKAFTELEENPRWGLISITIAFVVISITWVVLPLSIQLDSRYQMLESDIYDPQAVQKRIKLGIFHFSGVVLSPLPLLMKCLIFSGLLYFGARWIGSPKVFKFRLMYAVVVHAELILVLSSLINAAVLLSFKKVDDIQNFTDLQVLPGLHLLLDSQAEAIPYFTLRFLSQFHLFSIWYLWVLSLGVAVVAKLNMRKSVFLTVLLWLAIISFQLLRSLWN